MSEAVTSAPRRPGFFRRHKALTVLLALIVVLALVVAGWVFYLNKQLGDVTRFGFDEDRQGRPEKVAGDAVNILMVGVDNEKGNVREALTEEWVPGKFRTDSMMVMHVNADRTQAQVVSLPRDTWVPIPGHGDAKLNAAFSLGGPELLTQTIEDVTGLRLDHIVVIGLDGFINMSSAVGGVDVYVPETVTDTKRGKTWTKGTHHIEGDEAELYVRQRYGLPNGDFDRMARQQNFLRALLDKVASAGTLSNPVRVTKLVNQLTEYVAVDESFDNGEMRDLALSARGIRSNDIRFVTIPNRCCPTIDGQSTIAIDEKKVKEMFRAVAHDEFETWLANNPIEQLEGKGEVN